MRRLLIFFGVFAFACESNCINCHPKLKELYSPKSRYYKQHSFLKECTKCHKSHPSKAADKCGADCFECHSRTKLINTPVPQHQRLKECGRCHKSLDITLPNRLFKGF